MALRRLWLGDELTLQAWPTGSSSSLDSRGTRPRRPRSTRIDLIIRKDRSFSVEELRRGEPGPAGPAYSRRTSAGFSVGGAANRQVAGGQGGGSDGERRRRVGGRIGQVEPVDQRGQGPGDQVGEQHAGGATQQQKAQAPAQDHAGDVTLAGPSAIRIPSSRVRCVTRWAVTPNRPVAASRSASPAKLRTQPLSERSPAVCLSREAWSESVARTCTLGSTCRPGGPCPPTEGVSPVQASPGQAVLEMLAHTVPARLRPEASLATRERAVASARVLRG